MNTSKKAGMFSLIFRKGRIAGKHEKHALPVEGIDVEGPSRNGLMFPATFIAAHGVNSTEARKGTELQKLIRYRETEMVRYSETKIPIKNKNTYQADMGPV